MNDRLSRVGESKAPANRIVTACAGLAVLALLLSGSVILRGASADQKPAAKSSQKAATKSSETFGAPQKTYGSKSAPITLEVFSDFQCPSCRAFYEETLRPMINDYVASGKVYIVHHDFPLPMHKYGYQSARWANAAARVGDFPQVEAALYDNQDSWAGDGDIQKYVAGAMSSADFKRVEKLMQNCPDPTTPGAKPVSAGDGCPQDAYIELDRSIGQQMPVQATPTFVIYYKGHKISSASGVVSWPILKQFFDQLLKQG